MESTKGMKFVSPSNDAIWAGSIDLPRRKCDPWWVRKWDPDTATHEEIEARVVAMGYCRECTRESRVLQGEHLPANCWGIYKSERNLRDTLAVLRSP